MGETDAKARAMVEPALRYFFELWNRGFSEVAGTMSVEQQKVREILNTEQSFSYFRAGNRERVNFRPLSWEDLGTTGFIIAGSPDTVARKLKAQMHQVGAEHFMGMFHIGNLPSAQVIDALDLFHQEVMPAL
ncbi:MAG: hypothetical protein V3R72_12185 [Gammaproteobacteria bacterium]